MYYYALFSLDERLGKKLVYYLSLINFENWNYCPQIIHGSIIFYVLTYLVLAKAPSKLAHNTWIEIKIKK
jgi:hypothetical protein